MAKERKKHRYDRRDAYYVQETDSMHRFMPYLMPNRADNEAALSEIIELDAITKYLEKKNEGIERGKYTIFQVVAVALAKTVYHRPQLNRFYQGHRMYERKKITFAFTAKKVFADAAEERLMFFEVKPDSTIEDMHQKICGDVNAMREGKTSNTEDAMGILAKLPRWLMKIIMAILRTLDYHGKVPASLVAGDPNYASVFISNLGSIKINANYHHLNNWGTNSVFVVIGKKHFAPVASEDGTIVSKEVLPLAITLDERIADGYYYSKSVRLLKYLLEHPEELEKPIAEEVIYE